MPNKWRSPASTIQQRLARIQDPMRVKLVSNTEYNIADATDAVRIRTKNTYEGDPSSWVVDKVDVVNLVFPPLKDVPFRKIRLKDGSRYELTQLVSQFEEGEQKKNYTVTVPIEHDLDVNDLLFRIIDVGTTTWASVIILKVSEILGDFGHSRLIIQKCGCTIPTEIIPQEVVDTMIMCAKRRHLLGF